MFTIAYIKYYLRKKIYRIILILEIHNKIRKFLIIINLQTPFKTEIKDHIKII